MGVGPSIASGSDVFRTASTARKGSKREAAAGWKNFCYFLQFLDMCVLATCPLPNHNFCDRLTNFLGHMSSDNCPLTKVFGQISCERGRERGRERGDMQIVVDSAKHMVWQFCCRYIYTPGFYEYLQSEGLVQSIIDVVVVVVVVVVCIGYLATARIH